MFSNLIVSVIVPVFNEENTIKEIITLLQKVDFGGISKEIIIVNDNSTDKSQDLINELSINYKNIKSLNKNRNSGKGAAIRDALNYVSGDIIVIQDADLEYRPQDLNSLIKPILEMKTKVVYGSRILGDISGFHIASHYYGNKFLSFVTNILFGKKITDMETCYKMMTIDVIKSLKLKSNKFDIEAEITSKLLRKNEKIVEVPIHYHCRSFKQGKKITWKDGIVAIYTLIKYRLY